MARLAGPNRSPYIDLQTDYDQRAADDLKLRTIAQAQKNVTRLGPFPTRKKANLVMRKINARAGQLGGNRAYYRKPSAVTSATFDS